MKILNARTMVFASCTALAVFVLCTSAQATVAVRPVFGSNMVLQRDKPVPVFGTATTGATVTVIFKGQTNSVVADAQGNWRVTLDAMAATTTGGTITIAELGGNTLTFTNVVVGDVWIGSGQSNMAMSLGSCNRPTDVSSANFPGIRHVWVAQVSSKDPLETMSGSWTVCSPSTAGGYSAVSFYFARKIYQDQGSNIPIGMIASTVGGTCIDPWLAPEGLTDIPVLLPLYSQNILPSGPFSLFNGMIFPLAPYGLKGAIWYQGEARETTSQSTDSYFLKEKALMQGWKRLWGMDDFPLYVVQLANFTASATTLTPDALGTWADTRQMQEMVLALPHGGMGSAIDVGEAGDIHPKDKLDVGERLALWALKNDYGRTNIVPSGPVLRNVTVSGSNLVCSFDYVGAGLMMGSKTPFLPTVEMTTGTLQRFVIAGTAGSWYAADAVITDNTVVVSSPSVPSPRKVAYAYWSNPSGANLYNRDGLPASPFYVDDVTSKYTVVASAGVGGSISPALTNTLLKRRTALYTITPETNYYIQDVRVDGVSVGSVNYYTFDPVYANHTITAVFTTNQPYYRIVTTSTVNGVISPTGVVSIAQGGAHVFTMMPNPYCRLISVTVDNGPVGNRDSVVFADVRTNHTVYAVFAVIPPAIDNGIGPTQVGFTTARLNGNLTSTSSDTLARVKVYFGTTDGGTNTGGWGAVRDLGDMATGSFVSVESNLTVDTKYYYRCYCSNSAGVAWAPASTNFTTLASVRVVNTGATNVTVSSAVLNGRIVQSAFATNIVWIYWGKTDGGANKGAWATSNYVGVVTWSNNFFTSITGLDIGTYYYFRCFATNAYNEAWAPESTRFRTATNFTAWASKTKIQFKGYTKPTTLINFPALVRLGTNVPGFSYASMLSAAGNDLRFSDENGAELSYEIDAWNTNGISPVWVQVPALRDSNTYIWAYWGNAAAAGAKQAYTTNGATWSEGYLAVYHFAQINGATALNSTPFSYNGALINMEDSDWTNDAMIGRSLYFNLEDGNDEFVDLPDGFADFTAGITVEGWTKPAEMKNWSRIPLDFGNGAGVNCIVLANRGTAVDLRWEISGTPTHQLDVTGVFAANSWQYVVGTCGTGDGNATANVYKNGLVVGTSTTFSPPANVTRVNNYLGRSNWAADAYFRGQMDEVRVSGVARSADWIWASWMSQASNGAFCGYAEVSNAPTGTAVNNASGASAVTMSSAMLNGELTSTGAAPTYVYVYWGTLDGGTNKNAWATTIDMGERSLGGFSTNVIGLTSGWTYYYRCYASNAAESVWASGSANVTTLSGAPDIANSPASGITTSGATLNGNVLSTGAAPTYVWVFWGSSDGGTDINGWLHRIDLGQRDTGALATGIIGLLPSTPYYYRHFASNTYGESWSSASISFTTPNPPGPFVDITNGNATVGNAITTYTIGGTNNELTVGTITWTNTLGGSGSVLAGSSGWAFDIALAIGGNKIIARGTNTSGIAHSDTVTVTRLSDATGTGTWYYRGGTAASGQRTNDWNSSASWTNSAGIGGFPNATSSAAKTPATVGGDVLLYLNQDITVGEINWIGNQVYIYSNSPGNAVGTLIVDNSGSPSWWPVRTTYGFKIIANMKLLNDLTISNVSSRVSEIDGIVGGPGKLTLLWDQGRGTVNADEWCIGQSTEESNTYAGGTVLIAMAGGTKGCFRARKNGAFGSGNLWLMNTNVTLYLNNISASDDMIADSAAVFLTNVGAGYARISLVAGVNESVGMLYTNGVPLVPGTYGATGSGAAYLMDEWFGGTGILTVVPEPSVLLALLLAALGLSRRTGRRAELDTAETASYSH